VTLSKYSNQKIVYDKVGIVLIRHPSPLTNHVAQITNWKQTE